MNLYTSLTLRYLKENKKRTIVTIIGIILSTSLICGIGNIFESFMDYQIRETINRKGAFHATFHDIKKEDVDKITKSAGISKSSISDNLGYSKLSNEKKNLVQVKAFDKEGFEGYQIKLKEGRFPTNSNEIVLSERAMPLIDKKVGDSINLNIGKRVDKNQKEIEIPIVHDNETIVDGKSKNFKIVGVMNKLEDDIDNDVVSGITYLDIKEKTKGDKVNVAICANEPSEIYEIAPAISKNLGLKVASNDDSDDMIYNNDNGVAYENLSFNEHLLRLKGASAYANINRSINAAMLVVTTLVVVCTVATIYNAFSISINDRKKQFGILNSIGATKSQIIKIVFIEAIVVSVIGIPLGLITGTFAIDLIFKLIKYMFSSSVIAQLNLRVVYNPYVIILSALIVLLTILVSAILPALNAAKTPPLEAIKNSSSLKLGKVKDSKLVRLLFKTEGVLAYKNLRRNKKKFRITLFSLIISVVIFISFSGFVELFIKANKASVGQVNYDVRLWKGGILEGDKIIDDLNKVNGIKKISVRNDYGVAFDVKESNINKDYKDLIDKTFSKKNKNGETVYDFNYDQNTFQFTDDKDINNLKLINGSFDKETAIKENGIILRNKSSYSEPGKKYDVSLTNYKVGDTINAYKFSRDENGNQKNEPIKLKVLATTDDLLPGNKMSTYMGIDFITYNEVGSKLGYDINSGNIYINSDKSKDTRDALKKIGEKYGYNVHDEVDNALKMEQSIIAIKIFVYGFVLVISLVSITNIVNTISTNINLRKREFAIIKSIGVTPQGFNKMIYLESLLYGVLALLYGVPIGLLIDVIMNKIMGNVVQLGMILPWNSVLVSIVGVFVITFIASYIPMRKINKENIIENIRQESI
ncbi:ABC transporter permease,Macrolide export ATP-binding/permease protein MacB,macrolide transporter ATP-binding /permease protein,acidobacterial duplicated orphan permease,FtsX-like permease family [[Clostridium] sordellii]|uniref:ABC transporter permease n=1 Tax=Paraclostridium sordellii TaxID=1505 RepID=UPI0005427E6E|nr:ABC transporter permease [Paeniclostridium sordellii]CEK33925.1 ABC transporter permease,Macrolide export ATP-binding/permease protein MacB,macrolide transporter ATP-binding /permease protein,acidobacterial duplicated orphan permease,FtsX-like permease family [[Clostridium] sordellii] [Paeniclostridium sordellii]